MVRHEPFVYMLLYGTDIGPHMMSVSDALISYQGPYAWHACAAHAVVVLARHNSMLTLPVG